MESITKIIVNLERSVNDLQRDNDGMKQALLNVSTNVEALTRKVNMLEETLATKTDITHIQRLVKQSGRIHKMANNKLIIEVTADTTEALEGIKEVTEAANECAKALEKLEKVMGRLTNKNEQEDIKFVMTLGDKVLIKSIVEHTADSIQGRLIKGSEINETK